MCPTTDKWRITSSNDVYFSTYFEIYILKESHISVSVSIKMFAININLKIKEKKRGLRIFTRFYHSWEKEEKNPCITLRLILDFVFKSFDITPMLLNNLSNFYLHLFNLTFGLDLYLWCEMVISCKKHNVSFLRTLLNCRRPSYKILLTFN